MRRGYHLYHRDALLGVTRLYVSGAWPPPLHPQRKGLCERSAAIAYEGSWPLQHALGRRLAPLAITQNTDMLFQRLDPQLQLVQDWEIKQLAPFFRIYILNGDTINFVLSMDIFFYSFLYFITPLLRFFMTFSLRHSLWNDPKGFWNRDFSWALTKKRKRYLISSRVL